MKKNTLNHKYKKNLPVKKLLNILNFRCVGILEDHFYNYEQGKYYSAVLYEKII
jgi:hypothetical protein